MFNDVEMTILTLYSSRLGLYLLSAIIMFVIALVLKKQSITVAKYAVATSILYFISILATPIYAGYAGASPSFDELHYRVYSEALEFIVTLLLVLNLVLTLIAVKALSSKLG